MNWRLRIAKWLVRSTLSSPDSWFFDWLGGRESTSGLRVNPESAQKSSTAVFACVQARRQDMAKLPLILYQRTDNGRRRATEHPLYDLVGARPNPRQTSFEWREMVQAARDLRGNGYSRIYRDARYRPAEIVPLHDNWVSPLMSSDGSIFYDVRMYGRGKVERLTADDMLHIRGPSDDGFVGKSCIAVARDVVGLDVAGATYSAKLYANGARPGGILIPKGKIGKSGRELLRDEWNAEFGGVDNTNRIAVLGEEMDYKPVGMNNVDAEFVENRKLTRSEVAAIFRVPAHKIGIMDNATFSNIEQQALEYVIDTLMPEARRWEQTLNATLLREDEQQEYYFEFLFDGLLRGDTLSRMQAAAIGRQWGLLSVNDWADMENRNHVPGGDERLVPLNMWPLGEVRPEKTVDPNVPPGKAYENYSAPPNVTRLPARN